MRYLFGLLLLFTVLIDFTATCFAADGYLEESCHIAQETTPVECSANEDKKSHSEHSSKAGDGHCHLGHLHLAIIHLSLSPAVFNPIKSFLSFSDVNLFIPSSFLKDFTRPPITA